MPDRIIDCVEEASGEPPKTLRELGLERVLDRQITGWRIADGSYGMGGPGFFALEFSANASFPAERLVLTLWGAADWLLLDGRCINAHPNQWFKHRPRFSNYGHWAKIPEFRRFGVRNWDSVTPALVRSVVSKVVLDDRCSVFELKAEQHGEGDRFDTHLLELPSEPDKLSLHEGSQEPRVLHPDCSLWDAWIVTNQPLLLAD